ncbi:MAG: tetratricopeptide repeat protein, partial [Bacteroidales bacterium]|nr:tetratricopeptide repeat protein [Bacteroidales bacterium]
ENYNNSLELFKKSNNLKGIALNYLNIGEIYYELGKYDKATEFLNKSLEISEQIEDKNMIAECYYTISLLETKQNNYKLAEEYCLKSIDFFKNNNALDNQRKSLEQLAIIYNLAGKYQKAYNTYIKAIAVKDSVFNIEKTEKIAQLEEKYLNEKKDKQIQALEYENNIKTIKINHHKNTHIIYTIVLIFAIVAITIIRIQYRKKNKAYKFLVNKNLDLVSKEKELKNYKKKLQSCNTCFQNGVSDDKKGKIIEKLEKLFDDEKIYIKPDLTLNKLAKCLSTNRVYLSQIINKEFGKNYSDLINEYRVNEAILMLSDPQKIIKFSIKTIAKEAGFKSVSRFNPAFKKLTGITPSVFINNINNQ